MTYEEAQMGFLLMFEETVGRNLVELREQEDAEFAASRRALGG